MALTTIDDRGLKTPIDLLDNEKIRLGTGNDLELWHQTSNSYITSTGANLTLRAAGHLYLQDIDGNIMADFNDGGAVELYYDNALKLTTLSGGIQMANGSGNNTFSIYDSDKLSFGNAGDLKIYHNGSHSYIEDSGTGNLNILTSKLQIIDPDNQENIATFTDNGAVTLYYDNANKFNTDANGAIVTGRLYTSTYLDAAQGIYIPDNYKANFGAASDLQIYHNGYNSKIADVGTGALILSGSVVKIENAASNETQAVFTEDAGVDLYHNNSKVFETLGNGVRVQGGVLFGSDTADSNRINDYEEGGWTPTAAHATNYATQTGRYTKIGNMVYAYFNICWYSSSSSQQIITNLPFTSSNSSGGTGGVARGYQNKDIQDGPIYHIGTNTDDMYIYKDNGVAFPASDGSGNNFSGYVIYQTDA